MLNTDGLTALQVSAGNGKIPCRLSGKSGVVLGDVFELGDITNATRLEAKLDGERTRKIVNSEGRELIENCWGSYVGFIRADGRDDIHVICAPASDLPCLFVRIGEITLFFSRTEDCLELCPGRFSVNWEFVVRFLLHRGDRYIQGTGLNEVSRVLPGECVTVGSTGVSRALYWDPVNIAASEPIEDHVAAAESIRATTQRCVSAWASCHKSIVLQLSGGLDSSIVLSCLANAPDRPAIQCLNFVTPDEEGDERKFARLVATATDTPLHEMYRDLRTIRIDGSRRIERTSLPSSFLKRLFFIGVETEFARTHSASAYFTGNLGDELFLEGSREHMATDHVWHHGVSRDLLAIAYHEARVRQHTIWGILADALKYRGKSKRLSFYSELIESNVFLSKDVLSSVTPQSLVPAVVRNIESIAPGKRAHLLLCFPPLSYYDPLGDLEKPEFVAPLKSQPLLELCFRIPTFVLNAGGIGRALVRDAFSKDLPREIVRRRTKGTSTDMLREALRNNYDVLREMLLDGLLIEEGIVDRRSMERTLSRPEALTVRQMSQIPVFYSTEAWLQNWASMPSAKHAVA